MIKNRITRSFIFFALLNFIIFLICIFYPIYSYSIIFITLTIFYMILYFISLKMNLLILGKINDFLLLIPILLVNIFIQTNMYFELSIYDLDNVLSKRLSKVDDGIYEAKFTKIVDNKNKVIIDWIFFGNFIKSGKIEVKAGNIRYKIQLKDKCLTKNINQLEYKINSKKCDSINLSD